MLSREFLSQFIETSEVYFVMLNSMYDRIEDIIILIGSEVFCMDLEPNKNFWWWMDGPIQEKDGKLKEFIEITTENTARRKGSNKYDVLNPWQELEKIPSNYLEMSDEEILEEFFCRADIKVSEKKKEIKQHYVEQSEKAAARERALGKLTKQECAALGI